MVIRLEYTYILAQGRRKTFRDLANLGLTAPYLIRSIIYKYG